MDQENNRFQLRTTKFLAHRHKREKMFGILGLCSVVFLFASVFVMLAVISCASIPAFQAYSIRLTVDFKEEFFSQENLDKADYATLIDNALRQLFPEIEEKEMPQLLRLVSLGAYFRLESMVKKEPALIGSQRELWLPASQHLVALLKNREHLQDSTRQNRQKIRELHWLHQLEKQHRLKKYFSLSLFTEKDSCEPELAGLAGAFVGSLYVIGITFFLSFPIGLGTAIYLEEFAPKNRWISLLEGSVKNLAAVPPVLFGLFGLFLFVNLFGLVRSSPLVAGFVLSMMTIPVIVISCRNAIAEVPQSVRDAAVAIGASKMQTIAHHILVQASSGIIAGTLTALTRAFGEAAPLLMVGMVAFIIDIPQRLSDPATTLSTQIYLWVSNAEQGFSAKAAAAILVLFVLFALLSALAVFLRRRNRMKYPAIS